MIILSNVAKKERADIPKLVWCKDLYNVELFEFPGLLN